MDEQNLYPFQLIDVRLYEAKIDRLELEESEEEVDEAQGDDNPTVMFALKRVNHSDRLLSILLFLDIIGPSELAPEVHLDITLEGLFRLLIDFDDIAPELREEFEKHSAVSLLWPYAREYTQDFTNRMRMDMPVLPTLNLLAIEAIIAEAEEAEYDSD